MDRDVLDVIEREIYQEVRAPPRHRGAAGCAAFYATQGYVRPENR
jgi:hypothetical protein